MEENKHLPAIIWKDQTFSYAQLLNKINEWDDLLDDNDIGNGTVCAFLAEITLHRFVL